MSVLTESLERIFNWFQQYSPRLALSLKPGLTTEEIEDKVKELPFALPGEVYELYQWRNGIDIKFGFNKDNGNFLPCYCFLDIDWALEVYNTRVENSKDFPDVETWNLYWFPILFRDIEYYFVIGEEEAKDTATVLNFDIENGGAQISYVSLTNMMLTIAECYETGAYYLHEKGYPLEDEPKAAQILRKYNSELAESSLRKLQQRLSLESLTEITADLMKFKDSRAVEPLIQALQFPTAEIGDSDENMGIRALAARILGELGDARAVVPLIQALKDECWMSRFWAAIALGQLKDHRGVAHLIDTLQDEQNEVQQMAAWALVQIKAVEPLIQALKHDDVRVRMRAAWVLGEIKDSRAVEPLSQLTLDTDSNVRQAVQEALDAIGQRD